MADENLDMESVRISELDQTTEVDREKDYLVVSRHSDAYIDDEKSFKITPDDLLKGVGVNYNAGAHIAIDNNTHTISATYTNATTSADGLMSKEDKFTVDSLKPVATSGDYNDLTNKPTIPAAQVNSDWNSISGVSEILNKPTLATVATTGDYADLSNTPTIPDAISDLTDDVSITNPENDEVLKYDATSSKWINAVAPAGASALSDLTDVAISFPLNNQALLYDTMTHAWINKAVDGTVPVKDTAQGGIASFETNIVDLLQEVKCEINATGGNGTPDNPNPINGYTEAKITACGVNLFDCDSKVSGTSAQVVYTSDDNYIYMNGTKNGGTYATFSGALYSLKKGTYYAKAFFISGTATNDPQLSFILPDGSATGNIVNGATFTLSEDSTLYPRFAIWTDNTVFSNLKIGIVISTTSISEYSEYNGTTHVISFGQTVYGGVLDVTRGKLHVTHIKSTLPEITGFSTSGEHQYVVYSPTGIENAGPGQTVNDIISSVLPAKTSLGNYFGCYHIVTNIVICVPDNYTVADYNNEIAGSDIVFPLAMPFDIDLTPVQIEQLLGKNNVWHDANGDTEVKYYTSTAKDIKDFIETSIDVDDLANVDITTPSEGQTLVYDSTNSKWVNGTGGGGSAKQTAVTQAEYNALVQAGTVDPTMEYFITDGIPAQSKIPDAPATDGTYHLSVTVASGVPTYSWVSD